MEKEVVLKNYAPLFLAVWMLMNVSTVILNKYIYQVFNFKYPFSLTGVHMAVCFIGAFILLRVTKTFPMQPISSNEITRRILPLSLLFCSNIILGNISLRWVPVSFMQTVKSSVPAFTVILQILFFNKTFSRRIYLSMIPIVGGVVVASYTEVNYNHLGFWSALLASVITALIAIVSGMILTQQLDPINLLYYMAPFSFLTLLPFIILFEYEDITTQWEFYGERQPVFLLILSGVIAFLLNVFTFLVIKCTSALTYTVAGNFKVVFSIIISVAIFRNKVTIYNGLGCAIAILGVMWYNQIKLEENRAKEIGSFKEKEEKDTEETERKV
eukprot:TRINITY_DN3361_c0_g1_i2.p1 TRINITY_DN3361_c0_g1~~TRINITY_DN3361_c0_g1_i2.p1  ORF type:complete len:328 (-),score=45.02 TRINITY_DN3361_c0_g1_i2:53-1036(-)